MKNTYLTCLLLFLLLSLTYADRTSPILINPVVTNFDSLPAIENMNLFINSVDFSETIITDTLGFTRTGRKTNAPIVCSPSLDSILKKSVFNYLEVKKMNASDLNSAQYILDISILKAQITETSSGLTQTMTATLKISVSLTDPRDESNKRSFIIESENSKKTFDTTKSAEFILRGVIEGFIKEMIKSISN